MAYGSELMNQDSWRGPPDHYLVNDYKQDKKGRWCTGCKKYLAEAISYIKVLVGNLPQKDKQMA
eukprot:9025678-Ditylum_brightwellii.AAC.1